MQDLIKNTTCDNLVNYSNVSTSAANSFEYTPTDSNDSLAFLIKNNVLVNFSIIPDSEIEKENDISKEKADSFFK